jgi:hypothetical protein
MLLVAAAAQELLGLEELLVVHLRELAVQLVLDLMLYKILDQVVEEEEILTHRLSMVVPVVPVSSSSHTLHKTHTHKIINN